MFPFDVDASVKTERTIQLLMPEVMARSVMASIREVQTNYSYSNPDLDTLAKRIEEVL